MITDKELTDSGFKYLYNMAYAYHAKYKKTKLKETNLYVKDKTLRVCVSEYKEVIEPVKTRKFFEIKRWFRKPKRAYVLKEKKVARYNGAYEFTLDISKWNIKELVKFTESIT